MQTSRPARTGIVVLATGLMPVLLALALPALSRHPEALPQTASPQTPQQVADILDGMIQPRFQDLTAGKFGMSRISPAVPGHSSVGYPGYFRTQTPVETALLARADAAHRLYVIAFLHCAPVPDAPARVFSSPSPNDPPVGSGGLGSFGPSPQVTASATSASQFTTIAVKGTSEGYPNEYPATTEPPLRDAALKALPAAEKGSSVQTLSGPWTLFLRPVRATQMACLTCHTTAKWGDTLGVMVYAVSRTRTKS